MVTIIADTTSCISPQKAAELEVPFIPQIIIIGQDSYRDDNEIDSATFIQKLRSSPTLPKTAAPPPALYTPIYQKCLDAGESILVICPSAQVSGTVRSATVAAEDFPGADIRVIDTLTIGSNLGSIIFKAVEWRNQGLDIDTIEQKVRDLSLNQRVYFLVNTLEYLKKGGRIGKAQALFGSILQVKPILTIREGHTESVESQRTKRRALARLKEIILSECPKGPECMFTIMHAEARDEAEVLAAEYCQVLGIPNIPIYEVPPAIIVHAGPGVLAFSFFTKS
jgi:DegV family protein with EDD domain